MNLGLTGLNFKLLIFIHANFGLYKKFDPRLCQVTETEDIPEIFSAQQKGDFPVGDLRDICCCRGSYPDTRAV